MITLSGEKGRFWRNKPLPNPKIHDMLAASGEGNGVQRKGEGGFSTFPHPSC